MGFGGVTIDLSDGQVAPLLAVEDHAHDQVAVDAVEHIDLHLIFLVGFVVLHVHLSFLRLFQGSVNLDQRILGSFVFFLHSI